MALVCVYVCECVLVTSVSSLPPDQKEQRSVSAICDVSQGRYACLEGGRERERQESLKKQAAGKMYVSLAIESRQTREKDRHAKHSQRHEERRRRRKKCRS